MKDPDQISATLEYSRLYSGTLQKFVLILIVLCLIICLFCISFGILVICLSEVWEGVVFILFGALFGALAGYFIVTLHKNAQIGKIVAKSLEDAVLLEAQTRDITQSLHDRIYNGAKISLTFEYGGIRYQRQSDGKLNGHDKVFRRYVDRTIMILYSPTTKQILFLK